MVAPCQDCREIPTLPADPSAGARVDYDFDLTDVSVAPLLDLAPRARPNVTAQIRWRHLMHGAQFGAGLETVGRNPALHGHVGAVRGGFAVSGLLNDQPLRIAPSLDIGGVSYSVGDRAAGLGWWTLDGQSVRIASPLILLGVIALQGAITLATGAAESPADAGAQVASSTLPKIIPTNMVRELWAFLFAASRATDPVHTANDFDRLLSWIDSYRDQELTLTAIRWLDELITGDHPPFVTAQLMSMRDLFLYRANQTIFPMHQRNMLNHLRTAIERVEAFDVAYRAWLTTGAAPAPDAPAIDRYLADTLYLAQKMYLEADSKFHNGQITYVVTHSAPFPNLPGDLAVRYLHAVARPYHYMASPRCGLSAYLRDRQNTAAHRLLNTTTDLQQDNLAVLQAHAALEFTGMWVSKFWHLHTHFALRQKHLRWRIALAHDSAQRTAWLRESHEAELPDSALVRSRADQILQHPHSDTVAAWEPALEGLEEIEALRTQPVDAITDWGEAVSRGFDVRRAVSERRTLTEGFSHVPALLARGVALHESAPTANPHDAKMLRALYARYRTALRAASAVRGTEVFDVLATHLTTLQAQRTMLLRAGAALARTIGTLTSPLKNIRDVLDPDTPMAPDVPEILHALAQELADFAASAEALQQIVRITEPNSAFAASITSLGNLLQADARAEAVMQQHLEHFARHDRHITTLTTRLRHAMAVPASHPSAKAARRVVAQVRVLRRRLRHTEAGIEALVAQQQIFTNTRAGASTIKFLQSSWGLKSELPSAPILE